MNLIEQIEINAKRGISLHIGIDGMNIKNDLKQRVLDAIFAQEDFALANEDDDYAYFIGEGFMVYKSHDNLSNSVTLLKDRNAWENALKVVLLGHRRFVTQKALMLNSNYIYLKDGLRHEQLIKSLT